MTRRDFILFFVCEVLGVGFALSLFHHLEDPRWAGVLAGAGFLSIGLLIIWRTWRWDGKWGLGSFWMAHVQTWAITLPMILSRISHWEIPMSLTTIMGIPFSTFHRVSEVFYLMLMLATIGDFFRLKPKKADESPFKAED